MKKKIKIVLIGAGGHCRVVIDAIRKNKGFDIVSVIDNDPRIVEISGIKVTGNDSKLTGIFRAGCKNAFIAVGSVGDPAARVLLSKKLRSMGFILPSVIHPSAIIAENVTIGSGAFIAAAAVIGPQANIGENAIINTNSSVDHDCHIGDFVHIAPGVVLSGNVKVGKNSHIGTGAAVIEKINIGQNTIIGAGSVVISNIPDRSKAFGNPCKVMGKNE